MSKEDLIELEQAQDAYETAPNGFLSFLENGQIVRINQTLLDWLGLERLQVLNKKRFQDLIPPGERIFFETQFNPLLQMHGMIEEISFHLRPVHGERVPTLTTTCRYQVGPQGTIVNRMTIFRVADRKKYENELIFERRRAEAATKTKADFLSMLAHEIRTPLNAVVGVSNLLEGTDLDDEQAILANMLKSSSDNLLQLLNSILDLSKIESGKVKLESREFKVNHFAQTLVLGWQGLAQKKSIEVAAHVDPQTPSHLIGDPIKITQILSNLLGNAVKFTEKGSVSLVIRPLEFLGESATIRFEIQDTGIGISEENLKHIFEEFKQADYETESDFGGTGLGLTISQKLAELHGTKIQVESQLGVGSIFRIDLQLGVAAPSVSEPVEAQNARTDELKGLRVLIADDSTDNQALMRHFFKKWGVESESVQSGKAAFEKVCGENFDLVLMDMRMPDGNGFEAAKKIRALDDLVKKCVPIIAFSGSANFDGKELSDEEIFDDTLGKPFQPNELVEKLLKFRPSARRT